MGLKGIWKICTPPLESQRKTLPTQVTVVNLTTVGEERRSAKNTQQLSRWRLSSKLKHSPDMTQEKGSEQLRNILFLSRIYQKSFFTKFLLLWVKLQTKRKGLTKMRRGTKYDGLYKELLDEVIKKERLLWGYLVNFNWIRNIARKIYHIQLNETGALIKDAVMTFLRI